MMKKTVCRGLIFASLFIMLSGCGGPKVERPDEVTDYSTDYSQAVAYTITGTSLDLDAMNHYPQHIPAPPADKGGPFVLLVQNQSYFGLEAVPVEGQVYPESVLPYLDASEKITWDGEAIQEFIAKVDGEDVLSVVANAQFWTEGALTYDEDLARQISLGKVDTLGAEEALERGAGTCGEYANLMIAVLRAKGVPARFVNGVVFEENARSGIKGIHAWVEFYLQDYGWIPCDPGSRDLGVPNEFIKLAVGKDFVDVGMPFSSFDVTVALCETVD